MGNIASLNKLLLKAKREMNNPNINNYDCSNKFYKSIIYVCGKYYKNRTYGDVANYLIIISGIGEIHYNKVHDRKTFESFVDEILLQSKYYNKRTIDNE